MSTEQILLQIKSQLLGESTVAKVWGVASKNLNDDKPPTKYPEYAYGKYEYKDIEYWTSGFFPGSLYALLERSEKFPSSFPVDKLNPLKLQYASRWWSASLVKESTRANTHDLGFLFCPSFIREHELYGTLESLEVLINAANGLASRFDEKVGCIRSWDQNFSKDKSFTKPEDNYLVIIDNMCNLDLLYYVSSKTGDLRFATIATKHAETTLKNHFRNPRNWSCYHVVDYDQRTGEVQGKFTHQGYADESAWSRGQAWAIMGFADSFIWTKNQDFLEAARNASDYFLSRLPEDGVPGWDFDAPTKDTKDVSAANVAALGMLKIYEYTTETKYLDAAVKLIGDTIKFAYNPESELKSDGSIFDEKYETILNHSTMNNNEHAILRHADHGLVYADYYFLCIGNKLLDLGLL